MNDPEPSSQVSRRQFLRHAAAVAALGPLHALGQRVAMGQAPEPIQGYGPLINKGDLWLPEEFDYQIISMQGRRMTDGALTPGMFDGMGAFPGGLFPGGVTRTILIRNHENREAGGEMRVTTNPTVEYDPLASGGNTKLVVERRPLPPDPFYLTKRYEYVVVKDFAILGGTSSNCAGGELPFKKWLTCEEVVKRSPNGMKHGYVFEVDATADEPVPAVPVLGAGRMVHEAAAWRGGILYLTEDRSIAPDPIRGEVGACFYRYIPDLPQGRSSNLAFSRGRLQALRLKNEFHANMHIGREVGRSYPVSWVPIDDPDHDDDSDGRTDRSPGFIPTRIQGQDRGAAYFDRLEGTWATGAGENARVYFDATSGGAARLGQVWEYNPTLSTIKLLYESTSPQSLRNPDNVVVVPQTGDVMLCEDGGGDQFVRGLTRRGEIYDFVRTGINLTEFCGACFDRGGHTLYLNQQGDRGSLPDGPVGFRARTYAIFGPFRKRLR
jgi:uncharacterized protein